MSTSSHQPSVGRVSLPERNRSPWWELARRLLMALGILVGTVLLVYFDREGYVDGNDPNNEISLLDAFYYTTVTLSTTGYGDIAPFTPQARLVNALVITPARIAFLVLLIGTTLEVLASQGREMIRVSRWRKKMDQHVVVVGYGTKGRSAIETLVNNGYDREAITVVDPSPVAIADGNRDELVVHRRRRHPSRCAAPGRGREGHPRHHHHRPRRLQRPRHADRPPAQPRRLDRRRRARARERAADAAVRRQLGDHLLRRRRPAARPLVDVADARLGDGGPDDVRRGARGRRARPARQRGRQAAAAPARPGHRRRPRREGLPLLRPCGLAARPR